VADLSGRWRDLGVSLGIHLGDLEAILSDNPHSSSDCLLKMLSLWLKQNYKVWTSGATLELLHVCEAAMSCESEWKSSLFKFCLISSSGGRRLHNVLHVQWTCCDSPGKLCVCSLHLQVERFGKPTWRRLVEAVKDHVGGNNVVLAQAIAREHPGVLP